MDKIGILSFTAGGMVGGYYIAKKITDEPVAKPVGVVIGGALGYLIFRVIFRKNRL